MTSPLISVIIPAFEHARYVGAAARSALEQEGVRLEVIAIDDGSSDDTLKILSSIEDPRLHVETQDNQGAWRTINRGLSLATGDYLAILNSDDVFHPRRLARLLDVSRADELDLVLSDLRLIDAQGEEIRDPSHWWLRWYADLKRRYLEEGDPARALLCGNWSITTSNCFMSRRAYEILGGFRPLNYVLDYEYLLRASTTSGLKLGFLIGEPLLDYRLHGANTILKQPLLANLETDVLLRRYLPRVLGEETRPGIEYLNRIKRYIVKLDREHRRQTMQRTIDGLADANDALNAANQGLHAGNEELNRINRSLTDANADLNRVNQSLDAANRALDAERERLGGLLEAREDALTRAHGDLERLHRHPAFRAWRMAARVVRAARRAGSLVRVKRAPRARDVSELGRMIEESLAGVELVSFDIFDTLLERLIDPPDHVKIIGARGLARHLSVHYGQERSLAELLSLRDEVEGRLRRERLAESLDHECRFSDLAAEMARLLVGQPDRALADWIVAEELRAESDCLYVKPGIMSLLAGLRERGLRLIAVSDMYLDQAHLETLLGQMGLMAFIERIYVSSDTGIGKHTGRLFHHVLDEQGVEASRVLHIGDNAHSDVGVPSRLGIRSLWLDDRANNRRRTILRGHARLAIRNPYWRGRHLLQLIPPGPDRGAAFDLGYSFLGPVFCAFTLGVIEKVREHRIERLFFLAREGELFMRLFEVLASRLMEPEEMPAVEYLNVSRKSTAPAVLADGLSYETSLAPLYNPKQRGLSSLCRTFDIPPESLEAVAARHGYVLDAPIHDWHSPRYRALIEDSDFQAVVKRLGSERRALLEEYLEQKGFFSAARVGLVDIGWNGSSQRYFQDAFSKRPDYPHVFGLYMGWVHGIRHSFDPECNSLFGLLYDVRRGNQLEDAVSRFEELFEEGARALHATTLGYVRGNDGRVEPILKEDTAADRRAELDMNPRIEDFRSGALAFADGFVHAVRLTGYGFEEIRPFVMTLIDRLVAHPTRDEARTLMQITHSEDFGYDSVMSLHEDRLRIWDLLRPRRFVRRLRTSNWVYGSGRLTGMPGLNSLLRYLDLARRRP